MVRFCCICKVEQGSEPDVSLHNIPKNEDLKQKWFAEIGREVNKYSAVCSKHFHGEDFIYKIVSGSVRRFLLPTAVPVINSYCDSSVLQNRSTFEGEKVCEELENQEITSKLIKLKNQVPDAETDAPKKHKHGLIMPSNDVVTICKTAEKVIRSTPNLVFTKNILSKLMIKSKQLLATLNLFPKLQMFVEKTVLENNHRLDLIDIILKKFFNLRLYHEGACSLDSVQRIRTFHNRIVVFKNQ